MTRRAFEVCVERDVAARTLHLQQHIAAAVRADRGVVRWDRRRTRRRAVVQNNPARRRAQHDAAVARRGAYIAPCANHSGCCALFVEPVDRDSHIIDDQRSGLQHKQAAAARACGQCGDICFQRIAAAAHATVGANLQVKPGSGHVGGAVAVVDGGTGDQGHATSAAHSAQVEVGAGLDAHIAGGTDAAFAAHTCTFTGHRHRATGLQVDRAADATKTAESAQHQVAARAQAHRAGGGVYCVGHGGSDGEMTTRAGQGLHRHQGAVAGMKLLGAQQRQGAAGLGFDQADGACFALVAQAGGVDLGGEQADTRLCPHDQVVGLDRLGAQIVGQAIGCLIALGHGAGGRVQGDVLVGAGLADVGGGQQPVSDVDVAGGIELDRPLDGQWRCRGRGDVLDADAARIHLQWGLERELVGRLHPADADLPLTGQGVAAAIHMAQYDSGKSAGGDALDLGQTQAKLARVLLTGAADLHTKVEIGGAQREHAARRTQAATAGEAEFVGLQGDVAARHIDRVLELDGACTDDGQVSTYQGEPAVEGDRAVGADLDGQRTVERDVLLKLD